MVTTTYRDHLKYRSPINYVRVGIVNIVEYFMALNIKVESCMKYVKEEE